MVTIVTASSAVSNRESRYPRPGETFAGIQLLIRWPKIRIIRISDFLRIIRIIRIDKFFNSIFWKFWKPPNFYSFSSFQNFEKIKVKRIYGYLYKGTNRIQAVDRANMKHPSNHLTAPAVSAKPDTLVCLQFLMIILTKICDGTTFHPLWDHKILSKRDDWILHVSEVLFRNRSRIVNKLYIYTRTDQFSICEYWTLITQVVVTHSQKWVIPGLKPSCGTRNVACIIFIKNDSFLKIDSTFKMYVKWMHWFSQYFPLPRYGTNTGPSCFKINEILTEPPLWHSLLTQT